MNDGKDECRRDEDEVAALILVAQARHTKILDLTVLIPRKFPFLPSTYLIMRHHCSRDINLNVSVSIYTSLLSYLAGRDDGTQLWRGQGSIVNKRN